MMSPAQKFNGKGDRWRGTQKWNCKRCEHANFPIEKYGRKVVTGGGLDHFFCGPFLLFFYLGLVGFVSNFSYQLGLSIF